MKKSGLKEIVNEVRSTLMEEKIVELPIKKASNEVERALHRLKKEEEKEVANIANDLKKDVESMLKGKQVKALGMGKAGLISGTVTDVSVQRRTWQRTGRMAIEFNVSLTLDKKHRIHLDGVSSSLIVY